MKYLQELYKQRETLANQIVQNITNCVYLGDKGANLLAQHSRELKGLDAELEKEAEETKRRLTER